MNTSQIEVYGKKALMGVVQGNLPELCGSIGTYITFRDQPYALELTLDQLRGTALANSATGALVALFMAFTKKGGNNGSSNRRRHKKNNKKHQ